MPNRIRELREQNKLTLLQLAKKLGVSESTVQRYESGNIKNLKYDTMVALANIFGCNPAYLMGWEEGYQDTNKRKGVDLQLFGNGHALRSDESQLLNNYNLLNETGKEKAQDSVYDLTEIKRYRKDNKVTSFPVLNAAHERTDIDVTDEMLQHDDDIMDNDDEW